VVRENAPVTAVSRTAAGVGVRIESTGGAENISGSHLLLAVGRSANVAGLGLDAAGVEFTAAGVKVDHGLRTSNPRIFAIGDVIGGLQFTHVAAYHAALLVRRLLFKLPAKLDAAAISWVTFTDPELAQAGLGERVAREHHDKVAVTRWPLHDNDRARAERLAGGFIKVVSVGGRVVGATIVAPGAGDLILPWVLAIAQKLKLSAMAGLVAPYPTLGEISKRVAGAYYTPALFSARTKLLVRLLAQLG
jgi:pyruvate/2-oxoglutarate dehydrogenase complex dihydrolipoamide dehydrogenase (E3) component